jgi:NADH:ubiquinone oxidoreductase subunit 4 (subunit M)
MTDLLQRHLLSVLVFLPLAGAILLLLFPSRASGPAKVFALAVSTLNAILSLPLWWRFDSALRGFQFREAHSWIPSLGITYSLGIDGISLVLVLLTTILTPVSLLFSLTHVEKEARGYSIAFSCSRRACSEASSPSTSRSSTCSGRSCWSRCTSSSGSGAAPAASTPR